MLRKKSILGVEITNEKTEDILEYIFSTIKESQRKFYIVTPNPEMIVRAHRDPIFRALLNSAEIALADGVGITLAARLLRKPLKDRVTGTDFMERICSEAAGKPVNIGLLGGGRTIAENTAECLREKYPGITITFVGEEWPGRVENGELRMQNSNQSRTKSSTSIDILFVAFGAPKQEEWMSRNIEKIPVKITMGVGGAFDYISGRVPRAPQVIRKFGFEWLYRLIHQPWRWRRQLALIEFLLLVLRSRLQGKMG